MPVMLWRGGIWVPANTVGAGGLPPNSGGANIPLSLSIAALGQAPASGYPGPSNTGWQNYPGTTGSLTPGPDTVTNNTTYTNMAFDTGLTIGSWSTPAENITFRGCRFRSSWADGWNVFASGENIRFEYCTFEPELSQEIPVLAGWAYQYGIYAAGGQTSIVVDHCNFYGFGNAIQHDASSQVLSCTVQHSWIHDAADVDAETLGYHHDGLLSNNGGAYITLHHNTISSRGNTNGIALQSTGASYHHCTITQNWLSGFGYTVNIGDGYAPDNTFITFEDNVFSTEIEPNFGPLKIEWVGTSRNNSWRRNIWRVPAGAAQGNPADDGKFWMPTGGEVDVNNPGSAVNETDYTG